MQYKTDPVFAPQTDSKLANQQKMDGETNYHPFPKKIWKIILGHCKDTDDITNLLTVFPHLQNVTKGKECSWLIGQVMPLIFPKHIAFPQAKACRLVSHGWKNAVDKSLENHPDRRPYKCLELNKLTESHFNYCPLPHIMTDIRKLRRIDVISRQETSNPFPGRAIRIFLKDKDSCNGTYQPVLEKFGHHVYYTIFELPIMDEQSEELFISNAIQYMFICLAHLPNLRSLKLRANSLFNPVPSPVSNKIESLIKASAVTAPLETLDLCDFGGVGLSKSIIDSFIKCLVHPEQVKKFALDTRHWNDNTRKTFPNLVELLLVESFPFNAKLPLTSILKRMQFPNVRKLRIYQYELNSYDILKILSGQQIEFLELDGKIYADSINEGGRVKRCFKKWLSKVLKATKLIRKCSLCSVINLKVVTMQDLNFHFLRYMPSLQYFTLVTNHNVRECIHYKISDKKDITPICLETMRNKCTVDRATMHQFWKSYPSLKSVSLYDRDFTRHCVPESPGLVFFSNFSKI